MEEKGRKEGEISSGNMESGCGNDSAVANHVA